MKKPSILIVEDELINIIRKKVLIIFKEEEILIPNVSPPAKLKKVIRYMNENLNRKLTLPELAEQTDWNMYYFARIFKKYLNESPYQYHLKARIEKSKTSLSSTEKSIKDIAYDLGFENHSHFSQTFRKLVNMSPEDYRKKKSSF